MSTELTGKAGAWAPAIGDVIARCLAALPPGDLHAVSESLRKGGGLRFVAETDADDIVSAWLELREPDGVVVRITQLDIEFIE